MKRTDIEADDPPRKIWLIYCIAMLVVVLELLIAASLVHRQGQLLESDAILVDQAGKLRIQAASILYRLPTSSDEAGRASVQAALADFRVTYDAIVDDRALPAEIRTHFITKGSAPGLSTIVENFTQIATSQLANPTKTGRSNLTKLLENQLMPRLDQLGDALVADAEANSKALQGTSLQAALIAILILAAEVLLVGLPARRMLNRAFEKLQTRSETLRHQNQQIAEEKTKLEAAIKEGNDLRQEQAEFTYAISHDLKSPINTIKMCHLELAEVLKDRSDEEVDMFLELIGSTAERMGQLVADVLDYTCTLGEAPPQEQVDMAVLMQDIVKDLSSDIRNASGKVELGALPMVTGNKSQLRMLFQNLLSNGIKFRDHDTPSRIAVTTAETDLSHVALRVCDNGIGIAKEDQEHIFGLFNRLHLREEYPGTGLGLALCRRIVANHNGQIDLSSEPGRGTEITVTLPAAQDEVLAA